MSLILVNLRLLQAVRSVGSSGKFYQLPPDKKNTVNIQEFFHQTMTVSNSELDWEIQIFG